MRSIRPALLLGQDPLLTRLCWCRNKRQRASRACEVSTLRFASFQWTGWIQKFLPVHTSRSTRRAFAWRFLGRRAFLCFVPRHLQGGELDGLCRGIGPIPQACHITRRDPQPVVQTYTSTILHSEQSANAAIRPFRPATRTLIHPSIPFVTPSFLVPAPPAILLPRFIQIETASPVYRPLPPFRSKPAHKSGKILTT